MMEIALVIISAIVGALIWNKINPETAWIYIIYATIIVAFYLIAVTIFLR